MIRRKQVRPAHTNMNRQTEVAVEDPGEDTHPTDVAVALADTIRLIPTNVSGPVDTGDDRVAAVGKVEAQRRIDREAVVGSVEVERQTDRVGVTVRNEGVVDRGVEVGPVDAHPNGIDGTIRPTERRGDREAAIPGEAIHGTGTH